jgi:hypothetical protein
MLEWETAEGDWVEVGNVEVMTACEEEASLSSAEDEEGGGGRG